MPQPEIHVRADENVPYKFVAQSLADASKAGLTRIGFVSQPKPP
jgi:biopolymer transport protein ExbD